MSDPVTPWQEAFRVRSYEAGPAGRASIQSLCNYLQEAAGNSARALGFSVEQLPDPNLIWVLARLHVQVEQYPEWLDIIEVETWPSGAEGLYATREFVGYSGSETILKASSAWLLVDVTRKRPIRMPAYITEIVTPRRERPLPDPFPDLPQVTATEHERSFQVRYSDLDLNQHVNNVRYVEWAVESLPRETIEDNRLISVEVAFRAETTYGDTIVAQAQMLQEAPLTFAHRVDRQSDGRGVATIRTAWQSR